jgi:hypothetical protein
MTVITASGLFGDLRAAQNDQPVQAGLRATRIPVRDDQLGAAVRPGGMASGG